MYFSYCKSYESLLAKQMKLSGISILTLLNNRHTRKSITSLTSSVFILEFKVFEILKNLMKYKFCMKS